MSGRWLTFWCRLWNHGEPLWAVRSAGVGFQCPDCQRFRVSPVLNERRVI
jgi:hypothetical protein